jgi:hypothetical protein
MTGDYTFQLYATADRTGGLIGVVVNGVLAGVREVDANGFDNYASYSVPFRAQEGDSIVVWMYSPATPGYVVIDDATLTVDP